MGALIETFHIDFRLLLAQIINFAIVFAVLYFFALKPLMKVMQERTKKIEKSLDDAKAVDEKLNQTKAEYNVVIANAKKEASAMMEKTKELAEEKRKEMIAKAKEEIGQIINQEKEKMQRDKRETLKELKKEVADLVTASLIKIIGEKVDVKKDAEIIKKVIKQ